MSKGAIAKPPPTDREQIESAAEAFQRRIQEENNETFQRLRDQAQATLAAVKGSRAIRRPEDWEGMFRKAKIEYASGRFIVERLGAERLLEPELMATLVQLRQDLLAGIENPTAVDTMSADTTEIKWLGDLDSNQDWRSQSPPSLRGCYLSVTSTGLHPKFCSVSGLEGSFEHLIGYQTPARLKSRSGTACQSRTIIQPSRTDTFQPSSF
jgi:hypothetical protein